VPTVAIIEGYRFFSDDPLASSVEFTDDCLVVHLQDGRTLSVPLEWFPRLRDAAPEQRSHWRLIGKGIGVHWTELDEDLSVRGLLFPTAPAKRRRGRCGCRAPGSTCIPQGLDIPPGTLSRMFRQAGWK